MCEDARRSPGRLAQLACIVEVMAPKAGNVHPDADFDDLTWSDFVRSSSVCAPLLDRAVCHGVGPTVLACVEATHRAVGSNTNLGTVLLLAPLCAVPLGQPLAMGVAQVLDGLTPGDARCVYEAIQLANPGGLGRAAEGDVCGPLTMAVVDAMRLAADRDAVARQYVTGFSYVLEWIMPRLGARDLALDRVVVRTHLEHMAREPDSLIHRKCGRQMAEESQRRAAGVLTAGWPGSVRGVEQFAEFDQWLRADGHRRNPGTSADLIAAGLYAAMREGLITQPYQWSRPLS